jgi:nonsense-mediated mRNA decay protein 3
MCLKKIRGLNRVTLIDASFIWTEPHSKRVKVKITVQKEILNNTNINQSFVVEFIVHYQQCEDCKKEFTPHTWGALVQVRQKVDHKKTFFFLEQLILKHNAHEKVLNVKETHDGLDFFFKNKGHAMRLLDFLQSVFPIKIKTSKQLISQDDNSNVYNYKYVYSVELPKICKEDLVIISPKVSGLLGGCSNLLLCQKVSSVIHFFDPASGKTIEMNGTTYFQYEIEMSFIPVKGNTTEFMVFDIERPIAKSQNTSSISNATKGKLTNISVGRTSDWERFEIKTNLGDILSEGNEVIGYDLTSLNLNTDMDETKLRGNAPDVILVRKIYPERKKGNKKRIWKLKQLDKEEENANNIHKNAQKQKEKDLEEFMDDLEENPDMRTHVNMYRDEKAIKEVQEKKMDDDKGGKDTKKKVRVKGNKKGNDIVEESKEGDAKEKEEEPKKSTQAVDATPEIKLEELLSELTLNDKPEETGVEDDAFVDEFISKLERVKIEK